MTNNAKAYLFAGLAVLCWSTVATAFKIALRYQSPESLLLISSVTSFIVISLIYAFKKVRSGISIKKNLKSAIYGFFNPFLYYLVLFEAYSRLPAQEAQSLNYSWGLVLGILAVPVLKQRFKLLNFIALLMSFFGVIIISTRGDVFSMNFSDPAGVSLAVGSSVIWAVYWLMNLKDNRKDIDILLWNFFFGTIYILIYFLIRNYEMPGIEGILSSAYVGIFEMGITFLLWMNALKYTDDTSKVSNVIYLSPFISLIFISVILEESIYLSTFTGLSLIIAGIILQNYKKRKKK